MPLIAGKSAAIQIGLSDQWFAKRHRAILIGWLSALGSVVLFVAGVVLVEQNGAFGLLILAGLFLFLFGLIFGSVASRMVTPARITDSHVWLKGVCPQFLDGLPEWPYSQ